MEVDQLAGLNWTVDLKPVAVEGGITIPKARAVVRSSDGKPLSIVSDDYTPIQNHELRDIADAIVGEGGAHYHTAGSLNGGEDVWYLLRLPGTIKLPATDGTDDVEKFLLATNNFTGRRRCRILPTPVRVVCQNTLRAALGRKANGQGVSITHVGDTTQRIADAVKTVKMALGYYAEFETLAHTLATARYSAAQLNELTEVLFPARAEAVEGEVVELHWRVEQQRERIKELAETGKGHAKIAGTAWAAWNAVAEWTDWERGTDANRVDNAWFGEGARIKQRALQTITQQLAA